MRRGPQPAQTAFRQIRCDSYRNQRRDGFCHSRYSALGRNKHSVRRLPPPSQKLFRPRTEQTFSKTTATNSVAANQFRWFTSEFFTLQCATITFHTRGNHTMRCPRNFQIPAILFPPKEMRYDATATPASCAMAIAKGGAVRRLPPPAARWLSPQPLFRPRAERAFPATATATAVIFSTRAEYAFCATATAASGAMAIAAAANPLQGGKSMLRDSCRRQRRRYSAPGRNIRSLRRLPPLATASATATQFRWFTSDFFTLPHAAITFPRARQTDAKTPAQVSNPQWKWNTARRLTPQAARRLSPQQLFHHRAE